MKLILIVFSFLILYGSTLDDIKKAVKNNPKLLSIKKLIEAKHYEALLVAKFDNPNLNIIINDISLENPFSRDIEAMQSQGISLSQKIPTAKKLHLLKKREIFYKESIIYEYEYFFRKLYLEAKIAALKIASIENKIKILKKYKKLSNYAKRLMDLYSQSSNFTHTAIIKSEILESTIELKITKLKNLKKNYIKKLSQVIAKDINNIKIDLNIIEAKDLYKIDKRLLDHPKLKILKKIIDAKKEYIKYLKAQKIPDLKIKATYLNRENRYDYINLSFSFDLPIYNREEKSILIGLKELSSLNKKYENELLELKYGLENSLIDVEDAYKRYKIVEKILKDDLAHKLEVVLENLTVNTSTIESAIEILEKSLEFELQKIDILFDSNKAYSEVLYYLGDKL